MFKKYIERALTMSHSEFVSCLYLPATSCCEFYALVHDGHLLFSVKENDDSTFTISDQMVPSIVFFKGTVTGEVLRNHDDVDTEKLFKVLAKIRDAVEESWD